MNGQNNLEFAQNFLQKLGAGDSQALAHLFAEDARWEIAGDEGALPWLGKKTGREAIVDFVRDTAALITSESLNVHDILANEHRTLILGDLASVVKATGKRIETSFVLVLEVDDGLITSFRMLEDSFTVSQAARG
ncbi:nuclear transport factor 2 family protein [Pseudomonas sp. GW101-3H06]|uniref:nuclear transport factor 2 family protein n=1 Tax=Pseudomonas sp. GW101-3H06 TaxID=2751347 RepID=UPI001A9376C9|nr:nuclear transport factor 2 family protein [Pseudomonas sp. GW101-3H06]